jgi:hypothetical protein
MDELTNAVKDQLIPLATLFLPSSTILITALGVAKTEGLKTGVSALGLIISALWFWCNYDSAIELGELTVRVWVLTFLPLFFSACWIISLRIHGANYQSEQKKPKTPTPALQEVPMTLKLGMAQEEVIHILGEPKKIVDLGSKKIFMYEDMKIIFNDGKITDVQ